MASIACGPDSPSRNEHRNLAVAGRLIDGLAARDFEAVADTLAPDVSFRALLPRRVVELGGRARVRGILDTWFGGADRWELVEAVLGEVCGRIYLRWRVRLTRPDLGSGTFVVEQQVYADAGADGRLCDIALLCTGFLREDR